MTVILSIIIPFFNSEKYLDRCLKSIVEQEVPKDFNFEVVLINDGSTDSSLDIANSYCKKNHCFKLFTKYNEGVSVARNHGLKHSQGEYIFFLDSDDWIDKDFFSYMYPILSTDKYDIVFFSLKMVTDFIKVYSFFPTDGISELELSKDEVLDYFLTNKISGFNGDKIIKRSMYEHNSVYYPKDCIHEDLFVLSKLYLKSSKNFYTNKCLYYYYLANNNSLTKNLQSADVEHLYLLIRDIYITYRNYLMSKQINLASLDFFYLSKLVYIWGESLKYDLISGVIEFKDLRKKIDYEVGEISYNLKDIIYRGSLKLIAYKVKCLGLFVRLKFYLRKIQQ